MSWSRRLAVAVSAVALVGAAGCGGSTTQGTGGGQAQDQETSAAAAGAPRVTITSPKNGAEVGKSFPLMFTSSVPIGALETGADHVHVVVDGDTSDFSVVTARRTMVTNLSPGRHTVGITLQHADHSPAGAQDQVTVMVAKGAGATSGTTEDNPNRTHDDNGGTMDGSDSGNSDGFSY
jgi:hypothetical protein